MNRIWLGYLVLVLLSSQSQASTYSEFNAGISAKGHEKWADAITHFTAALAAPDFLPAFRAMAYYDRGAAYAETKQWDRAIADFTDCLKADPGFLDAYPARAGAYGESNHPDLAIADMTTLIARKPFLLGALAARGAFYVDQKNYPAAIADFTALINLKPKLPEGHELRGPVYRITGDLSDAMDDADTALRLNFIKSASDYADRGYVYEAKGEYGDAVDDFETAAGLAPKSFDIRMHLALAYWEDEKFYDALKAFTLARDSAKGDLVAYMTIWMSLSAFKAGRPGDDTVKTFAAQDKTTQWPRPIVDLYSGAGTVDTMVKAITGSDAQKQAEETCEANFYGGMWQEMHQNVEAAKAMLSTAAENCPVTFVERPAAAAERRRLMR